MHYSILVPAWDAEDLENRLAPYEETNLGGGGAFLEFWDTEAEYETTWKANQPLSTGGGQGQLPQDYYASFEAFVEGEYGESPDDRDEKTGRYGYWCNPNGQWDYYTVGGRWTGLLEPGYNPTQDPKNLTTCSACKGSGKTTDGKGDCFHCKGSGKEVKWHLDWGKDRGCCLPASEIPAVIQQIVEPGARQMHQETTSILSPYLPTGMPLHLADPLLLLNTRQRARDAVAHIRGYLSETSPRHMEAIERDLRGLEEDDFVTHMLHGYALTHALMDLNGDWHEAGWDAATDRFGLEFWDVLNEIVGQQPDIPMWVVDCHT